MAIERNHAASAVSSIDRIRRYAIGLAVFWSAAFTGCSWWFCHKGQKGLLEMGLAIGFILVSGLGGILFGTRTLLQRTADLENSSEKFRSLVNNVREVIFQTDTAGAWLFLNPAWQKITGHPVESCIGRNCAEFQHPDDRPDALNDFRSLIRGETDMCRREIRFLRVDGGTCWLEAHARPTLDPAGAVIGVSGTLTDITERKQAEKSLRESEKLLSAIIESEPECVKLLAADGSLVMMNRAGLEMIQAKSFDQVQGKSVYKLIAPPYREAFKALTKGVFQGNPGYLVFEMTGLEGRQLWLDTHAVPLRNEQGDIVSLLGITRDITERKRTEDALRESEEHVHQIFDQTNDAIVLFRMDTFTIVDANPAALRMFDVTREELAQTKPWTFITPQVFRDFIRVIPVADTSQDFTLDKAICFKKDGAKIIVSILGKILKLKNEYVIFCSIRDITEKVRLEGEIRSTQAKLIHTNKMTSLGMLVSGIAHEINNPNHYISVNASMLADVWQDAAPILKRYYDEHGSFHIGGLPFTEMQDLAPRLFNGIAEGSRRINAIVTDMRDFVREDKSGLQGIVDVNRLISNAESILWHHIHKHTDNFHVELQVDLPTARGNGQQLEQVIINLIVNALQALPDKDAGVFVTTSAAPDQGNIVITVRDEGKGMRKNVMEQLKEPFFTTKLDQGGTGLGLYIADSIIKEHNGSLEFKSALGRGTTATIRLPAAGQATDTCSGVEAEA